jgi:hypothetical protein
LYDEKMQMKRMWTKKKGEEERERNEWKGEAKTIRWTGFWVP